MEAMIRYYWGRFWPFLLFAFGIEVVENLFTVFLNTATWISVFCLC